MDKPLKIPRDTTFSMTNYPAHTITTKDEVGVGDRIGEYKIVWIGHGKKGYHIRTETWYDSGNAFIEDELLIHLWRSIPTPSPTGKV